MAGERRRDTAKGSSFFKKNKKEKEIRNRNDRFLNFSDIILVGTKYFILRLRYLQSCIFRKKMFFGL